MISTEGKRVILALAPLLQEMWPLIPGTVAAGSCYAVILGEPPDQHVYHVLEALHDGSALVIDMADGGIDRLYIVN